MSTFASRPPLNEGLLRGRRCRYTISSVEETTIVPQRRIMGVLIDHAHCELSEVQDCENKIGSSIRSYRATPWRLDYLSFSLSALCLSVYRLPRQAHNEPSSKL